MIARITNGGGASTTVNQATGENDGPGLPLIAGVAAAGYVVYRVIL